MKIGIIGPAASGKTSLFNALTGLSVQTGAGAKKTHIGAVNVPDERVEIIRGLTGRSKAVHAQITFSDVAGGLGKPSREHGMAPELLNMMKPLDAFAVVLPSFDGAENSGKKNDPLAGAREIESDLMLADLVTVENKINRMKREPAPEIEKNAIEKCKRWLDEEKPLRLLELNPSEEAALSSYAFLSLKPAVYIQNIGEEDIGAAPPAELVEFAQSNKAKLVQVCAKLEMEIAQLEESERKSFREEMGLKESALERFVRAGYEACELISFFTTGTAQADEVKAWTLRKGLNALEAAGKIHSDIKRGFIRAEVINFEEFVKIKSIEAARAHGKIRLEGKDYIVQDGDIIQFRFNI